MQLERVQDYRRLEDHAYDQLRNALRAGVFAPRQSLSAEALSKELGVSRMPVVQALRRLASEGFVVIEAHKPVRVADPTPEEIRERYLVIAALESVCVRESFRRDPAGVAAELQSQLQASAAVDAEGADGDYGDFAFHEVVWRQSGLQTVTAMLATLWDQGGYYRALLNAHGGFREARLAEHRAIVEAAELGDAELVTKRLEQHRMLGMERMLGVVADRNTARD